MTGSDAGRGGSALARVQTRYPGWVCWAGGSGTCYAVNVAALRADPPPPFGEVYALRASGPADLLRQLRAGQNRRTGPVPGRQSSPSGGGDLLTPAAMVGLLPAKPGPLRVSEVLRTISGLCARAAWIREYGEPGERTGGESPAVGTDELTALSELAALGAELIERGYFAHLTMAPAFLTIGHPLARRPVRIYAEEEFLCWGDDRVPLCERWIVPAAAAAGEVEVRMVLAIAHEHETAAHPQEPQ
jgi:hypothetical protein